MTNVKKASSYIYVCMSRVKRTQTIDSWINWLHKKFDRFDIWKLTPYKNLSISISSFDWL